MNKLKLVLNSVILLFTFSLYIACSNENVESTTTKEQSLEIDTEKINSLLKSVNPLLSKKASSIRSKMAKQEDKETLMLTFLVVKNNTTGQIALTNFKESSFFPISFPEDDDKKAKRRGGKYVVSCTVGGQTNSSNCNSKWSCGSEIAKCLDKGGCAEICAAPVELIDTNIGDFASDKVRTDLDINNNDDYTSVELSFIPVP